MIISIRRILFPTDFSEPAKEAQHYATALADQFGAELHLLHVVPQIMPYADASSSWIMPENETQLQVEGAERRLAQELDSQWADKHPVTYTTIIGFAVDEILKYATDHEIDLIILGTHGHSWLSHMVIGSVAEKLVRLASCPVLTVHPQGRQFVIDAAPGTVVQSQV